MDVNFRTERVFIKLLLGGLVGFILFVTLLVVGYRSYKKWEARRLVKRAETYLSWNDTKSAVLTARRAFQLDAASADACRVLATSAERSGEPAAIDWRQQVLSIVPGSVEDGIALARTALQFGRIPVAEAALSKLGHGAASLAPYHEAQAQLAVAKKDPATAEREYAEAVKLDPSRKLYQLNLAVFQLQSTSRETRDRASGFLQQFLNDKSLRLGAARALRDYAAQRKDSVALLGVTEQLFGFEEASFRDRISYLQVLQALGQEEFAGRLGKLQTEAASDPAKLATLLAWMNSNHLALLALDWIKRLTPDIKENRLVKVAIADSYVAANDASGLTQWCKAPTWGEYEFLRHAYLAWSARTRAADLEFQSEWNNALRGAGDNGDQLFALEQDASKWNWKEQAEQLLWQLTRDPRRQLAALTGLSEYYNGKGDTAQLYRAVSRLCELKPDDDAAQNNLANLSLLLNLNIETANATAERLYRAAPSNPVFASTYAFSIFLKGKPQQAVQVMEKLNAQALEQPAIAAYYAVFLAASGDKENALKYLDKASTARLLPEEAKLVERAKISVGRANTTTETAAIGSG